MYPAPVIAEALRQAREVVKADRGRFKPFLERGLEFARREGLAVGGDDAASLHVGLGIELTRDTPIELHVAHATQASRRLVDHLASEGVFVVAKPVDPRRTFNVSVDERVLFVVTAQGGATRGAVTIGKTPAISRLAVLLQHLGALTDPSRASEWAVALLRVVSVGQRHFEADPAEKTEGGRRSRRARKASRKTSRESYTVTVYAGDFEAAVRAEAQARGGEAKLQRVDVPGDPRLRRAVIARGGKAVASVYDRSHAPIAPGSPVLHYYLAAVEQWVVDGLAARGLVGDATRQRAARDLRRARAQFEEALAQKNYAALFPPTYEGAWRSPALYYRDRMQAAPMADRVPYYGRRGKAGGADAEAAAEAAAEADAEADGAWEER